MKVLFLTRKYPPSEGGMETAAFELHAELAAQHDVHLIKWSGSNRWLPVVYPWLLLRALLHCWLRRPDVVYLQDGAMAPAGSMLRRLAGRPTVITVHGLDVTYSGRIYRWLVAPRIADQTAIVAVSAATAGRASKLTGRKDIRVINNGAGRPRHRNVRLSDLSKVVGELEHDIEGRRLIYLSGRVVERKGFAWFLREVLPSLSNEVPDVLCVISGDGPEADEVKGLAESAELEKYVRYLGRVGSEARDALYSTAELFVMPNIPVEDNIEGFGLVATEAAASGTPVIAAATGGITDAVIDGANGRLVTPGDADAFAATIRAELDSPSFDRSAVEEFTLDRFSWLAAANQYTKVFESVRAPGS